MQVTLENPQSMNLLGLILARVIEENARRGARARVRGPKTVAVRGGPMSVSLEISSEEIRIFSSTAERADAAVVGTLDALLGVASGNMLGPLLSGRLRVSGDLLLLLRILPLIRAR